LSRWRATPASDTATFFVRGWHSTHFTADRIQVFLDVPVPQLDPEVIRAAYSILCEQASLERNLRIAALLVDAGATSA
jgi:hypothetical protein